MLSFDASLTDALTSHATKAFFVLKLYYNAEGATDFIGVSDQDRTDGTDVYYGLATWGSLTHSLDFFNFTTSTMNMSVKLINTDKTIQGGRFSDLFSSKNFANRKWELFLNTDQAGTYDTAARMIGSGIISGDIGYSDTSISVKLLDYSGRYHKQLPANVIDSTTYSNASQKNINKPAPMTYGNFDVDSNAPGTNAEFDRHFVTSRFPAIITNEWNVTNSNVECHPDVHTMNQLRAKNLFIHTNSKYSACEDTNVGVAGNPKITFKGSTWRAYVQLSGGATNMLDKDFTTAYNIVTNAGNGNIDTETVGVPKFPKLGEFVSISVIIDYDTANLDVAGGGGPINAGDTWKIAISGTDFNLSKTATDEIIDVTAAFTGSGETDPWDFEGNIVLTLDTNTVPDDVTVPIFQIGVEIEYAPSGMELFEKLIREIVPQWKKGTIWGGGVPNFSIQLNVSAVEKTILIRDEQGAPKGTDYVYVAGKGREYGAYIDADSRDQDYNAGASITNPIFQIEDILRREFGTIHKGTDDAGTPSKLSDAGAAFTAADVGKTVFNITDGTTAQVTALDSGTVLSIGSDIFDTSEEYIVGGLTSSEIDYALFDVSGDSTSGTLLDILNVAIASIEYAFSQYEFINSKDLINRICKQIFSWVFIGGDGKFKIKTLRRTGDYAAADKTIDFKDIDLKSISKTPLGSVRNDITIHYNHDYGQDQFLSSINDTDATSQGATVAGVLQVLKLELDADTYNLATATAIADAYMTIFKDRKVILTVDCKRPKYNDLEIGDIIDWTNWDSSIKIYGTAMVENGAGQPDYYKVTRTSKRPNGCSLTLIKVSE